MMLETDGARLEGVVGGGGPPGGATVAPGSGVLGEAEGAVEPTVGTICGVGPVEGVVVKPLEVVLGKTSDGVAFACGINCGAAAATLSKSSCASLLSYQ